MADQKITRRLNIFINGKQVEFTLSNLSKAYAKAKAKLRKSPIGTKDWEAAGREVERLGRQLGKANEQQKKFFKTARSNKSLLDKGLGLFGIASGALLAADGIKSVLSYTKSFIKDSFEIAERAKGIDASFNLIERSTQLLKDVRRETEGLISNLDIKSAANQFKEFKLDMDKLPILLKFSSVQAAKTGADFENMFSSLVEGLSKESKLRIDNLGISQKELNSELEKTPDFVTAVANIAERKFSNTADILNKNGNESQRWAATLENAQERIGKLVTGSGFTAWLQRVGSQTLEAVIPTKTLREEFEEQAERVLSLQKSLPPLLDEYDSLKSKAELTKDEQSRLKTIIGEVAGIVPSAITEFDEYGNALDISTEKAKQFIDVQKQLLEIRNSEALEERRKQLARAERQLADRQAQLSKRDEEGNLVRNKIGGGKIARIEQERLTPEEIAALQVETAQLQNTVAALKVDIEELSGEAFEKYVKRQAEQQKAELEAAQKRARELGLSYENLTAVEIRALVRKHEAINERQAELDKNQAEKDAEKAKREAEAKRQREIRQRQQLQEALDEFEADRALQEEIKQLKADQQAEAKEIAEIEKKFQKLTDLANGEKELLVRLEEEKQKAISDVKDKYRQQRDEKEEKQRADIIKKQREQVKSIGQAEAELQDARNAAIQSGVATIRAFSDRTSAVYKAIFAGEKLFSAGVVIQKGVEERAKIAAAYAAIPGGQAISKPLIQASKLRQFAGLASIASTAFRGFEKGGFTEDAPTFGFDTNGKRVKGFVHDYEYVIPKFVRKDPEVPAIIDYLENKRQNKLNGIGEESSTRATISTNNDMLAMAINRLVNEGVVANTFLGDEKILEFQERQSKLNQSRDNAIVR